MVTMFDMNALITRMEEAPNEYTFENAKLLLSYFPQQDYQEAAQDLEKSREQMHTQSDQILKILGFMQTSDLDTENKNHVQQQLNDVVGQFNSNIAPYFSTVLTFEEEFGSVDRHYNSLKIITDKALQIFNHYHFSKEDLRAFEGFKAYATQNHLVCQIIASVPQEKRQNFITMAKAFSASHDDPTEKPRINIKIDGPNTLH